jgi:hypothetical protein
MTIGYKFSSEHWWHDIEHFADLFFVDISKQDVNGLKVKFESKALSEVKDTYFRNLMAFKAKIYGKDVLKHETTKRIDRHKIVALYIKSFLEISPFHVERSSSQCKVTIQNCPNEFFLMELMYLILIAWNKKKCEICMVKKEKEWFIRLLNHYQLEIDTLDVLSLAQIIYYIEDKYIKNSCL